MGAISLKLSDELIEASGDCARALHLSRAEYIRRAIERLNQETRMQLRARRLAEASRKVRAESIQVNAEFAAVEPDQDAELGARSGRRISTNRTAPSRASGPQC